MANPTIDPKTVHVQVLGEGRAGKSFITSLALEECLQDPKRERETTKAKRKRVSSPSTGTPGFDDRKDTSTN
jgi:hypothetical protein